MKKILPSLTFLLLLAAPLAVPADAQVVIHVAHGHHRHYRHHHHHHYHRR